MTRRPVLSFSKDGAKVRDLRYEPAIEYPYDKEQTEAERLALCEEERKRSIKRDAEFIERQSVVKSRIGTRHHPFPKRDGFPANRSTGRRCVEKSFCCISGD